MKTKKQAKKESPYQKLAKTILTTIVSKPDAIEVLEENENGNANLSIRVEKEDMGRVIGKNGKVIKAIRNMLRIRAIKEGKHVNLTLLEEEEK